MPMTEDEAVKLIKEKRLKEEKAKREFLANYPASYPVDRKNQEWAAYRNLRRVWTHQQIEKFINNYKTKKFVYPGSLDQPGKLSLTEFLRDLKLLVEGRYARSLPEEDMLLELSGEDAVRGRKQVVNASKGGKTRAELHGVAGKAKAIQKFINTKHLENPNKSYSWLQKLAAKEFGCSERSVRSYTKNPKKS